MHETSKQAELGSTGVLRLETYGDFPDFELLDSGHEEVLERWGSVTLVRPSPQAIWEKHLPQADWEQAAAFFNGGKGGNGWQVKKHLPNPWLVSFRGCKFLLRLTPFKHTGLFAEQASQWQWMLENPKLKTQNSKLKILNLFAYTGGATMMLASAGHFVTHVDASKPSLAWAKENHALNRLPPDSVRWILDDAVKFVRREVKRGVRYDGIVMDPPAFGHGPSGKVWKFNEHLPALLSDCVKLLSDNPAFLLINGYATNSSALALKNLLEDAIVVRFGTIDFGELCLEQKDKRLLSTGIFARWSLK